MKRFMMFSVSVLCLAGVGADRIPRWESAGGGAGTS